LANVLTNEIKRHRKNLIQLNKPKQLSTVNKNKHKLALIWSCSYDSPSGNEVAPVGETCWQKKADRQTDEQTNEQETLTTQ